MIRRCEFERALAVIHRAGVHTELELILRPPANRGRPRALRVDVFCAAVMCAIAEHKTATLSQVHEVLTEGLARSYQVALGIRPPGVDAEPITMRQVRYMLEALERKLSHTQGRTPDLTEHQRLDRKTAVQTIADKILDATMPSHVPRSRTYALDATAIDSFARGTRGKKAATPPDEDPATHAQGKTDPCAPRTRRKKSKRSPKQHDAEVGKKTTAAMRDHTRSHDPDAMWGYRTKTFDNKTTWVFGYQGVAFAPVNYPGPSLIHRLVLAPGNSSGVPEAVEILQRSRDSELSISRLLCDRAFSNAVPENWKDKLRELGIEQTIDINHDMHGGRDYEGAIILDGTPHCPRTPQALHIIKRPANLSVGTLRKNPTPTERLAYQQRVDDLAVFKSAVADRQPMAFRRVAGPDKSGKERWECPACAGTVKCSRRTKSTHLPAGTPVVDSPPDDAAALKSCTQRSITVPGNVNAKLQQPHYWGSDAWITEFSHRSRIEGAFGNIKNADTERVKRGWIRVVGHLKTMMMLVLAVATSNLRQLRAWAERVGDFTDPLTAPDPVNRGFEEIEQPTNAGPATTRPPDA